MANFVDLTEEYMIAHMLATFVSRTGKQSDYEYAKRHGQRADTYATLGFYKAYNYVWSSEGLCRDFYDKDFKLVGKVYYQAIAGKDPRVLFPFKIEYYENEELIEYLLMNYDEFTRYSVPRNYFRREDHAKDDSSKYPYTMSLMPALKEWFDDTIFDIQRF